MDVIPANQQKAVMEKVLAANGARAGAPPMSKTSYYFTYYVTRALEHCAMADRYLSTLGPWRTMLTLGSDDVGRKSGADPFRFARLERAP